MQGSRATSASTQAPCPQSRRCPVLRPIITRQPLRHKCVPVLEERGDALAADIGVVDAALVAQHVLDHRIGLQHLVERVRDAKPAARPRSRPVLPKWLRHARAVPELGRAARQSAPAQAASPCLEARTPLPGGLALRCMSRQAALQRQRTIGLGCVALLQRACRHSYLPSKCTNCVAVCMPVVRACMHTAHTTQSTCGPAGAATSSAHPQRAARPQHRRGERGGRGTPGMVCGRAEAVRNGRGWIRAVVCGDWLIKALLARGVAQHVLVLLEHRHEAHPDRPCAPPPALLALRRAAAALRRPAHGSAPRRAAWQASSLRQGGSQACTSAQPCVP
jgi:hypothetical protein